MTAPRSRISSATRLLAVMSLLALALAHCRPSHSTTPLTIAAGASLTDALAELASLYEQQHHVPVRCALGASSTLSRQIAAGMPADLFISANEQWMDDLASKNLIQPDSRIDLLTNKLVLIIPRGAPSPLDISPADILSRLQGRLAVGDPEHVPAGIYAKQALTTLGLWDALKDRLAPAPDVRSALRMVEARECPLGIVYASDAQASPKVRVVAALPDDSHHPILFPAALTASAQPHAAGLLAFLRSEPAAAIFAKHGFAPIQAAPATQPASANPSLLALIPLSPSEWSALRLSIEVALLSVGVILPPGLALGWLLARKRFAGKSLLEALAYAPLVVPPVVTGYVALLLLGRDGPLGRLLEQSLGLRLAFTTAGAVVAAAIMALPLLVRSVRLAVELTDLRLEQAASVLGASPCRVFCTITLPLALPGVLGGVVLAAARSLGEFGATVTLAGNLPGQTQTLSLAVYSLMQTPTPHSQAAALRLTLLCLLISLAALAGSELLARRMHARLGAATTC